MNTEVKLIKAFLIELGLGKLIKVRASKYTCAALDEKIIYFSKDAYQEEQLNKLSYKHLLEDGYDFSSINYGTFSVLHEIGHIATIGRYGNKADKVQRDYTRKVYKLHRVAKKDYLGGMSEEDVQAKLTKSYRQLQLEKDADKFAYEMLTSFLDEIKAFDAIMCKEFASKMCDEDLEKQGDR